MSYYYNDAALLGGWNLQPDVYTEAEIPEIVKIAASFGKRHNFPVDQVMNLIKLIYKYDTLLAMGEALQASVVKQNAIHGSPARKKWWDSLRRKIHWGGASRGKKAKAARREALRNYLGNPDLHWYGSAPPTSMNPYGRLTYRRGNTTALQPYIDRAKAAKAARLAAAAAAAPVAAVPVAAVPVAAAPVVAPSPVIPSSPVIDDDGIVDVLATTRPISDTLARRREFTEDMRKQLRSIRDWARRRNTAVEAPI